MSFREQDDISRSIVENYLYLETCSLPDQLSTKLGSIALRNGIPRSLKNIVGSSYSHVLFNATSYAIPERQSEVDITLLGDQPMNQMHIRSSQEPVEFGRYKQFELRPEGVDEPLNTIPCDDFCLLLDEAIPYKGLAQLADPRCDYTFDEITNSMTESLAKKAKSIITTRSYIGRDCKRSSIESDNNAFTTTARLAVKQQGSKKTYNLSLFAPLDLGLMRVLQRFSYQFSQYDQRGRGNGLESVKLDPHAEVTLSSREYSETVLKEYLPKVRDNTDGYASGLRALQLIFQSRAQPKV